MQPEADRHAQRRATLVAAMRATVAKGGDPLRLGKQESNLFRDRQRSPRQRIDLSGFCHVLEINTAEGWVDVEGLTTYEQLVAQTLAQGVMPAVVPQLKTITVGGAVAGVGIEASSHRYGLVHHSLLALDVLLPDGEVLHCTPDNAHQDLFFGFPNAYGTLGYALRLRLRTVPVKPFVRIDYRMHAKAHAFFSDLAGLCGNGLVGGNGNGNGSGNGSGHVTNHLAGNGNGNGRGNGSTFSNHSPHPDIAAQEVDFVDGVVFGPRQQVVCVARFVDEAPWVSDYGYEQIYYRSLLDKTVDYLRVQDYLWRWDTDWFWCSKNFGAQRPLVRRLLGRSRLNSRTYTRWMRWNDRLGISRHLARLRGQHLESVIQDVDIPIASATAFLAFLLREVGILPIWICPVRAPQQARPFTLYPVEPGKLWINFGFWDTVASDTARPPGHVNRVIEQEVMRLHGVKSLYSDSYFTPEEFAQVYATPAYEALKDKYDPLGRMLDLYDKCVLRA